MTKPKKRAKSPAAKIKLKLLKTPPPQAEVLPVPAIQTVQKPTVEQLPQDNPPEGWSSSALAKAGWIEYYQNNLVSITKCCQVMHVPRQTYYYWMENDPAFKMAVQEAEAMQNDLVEDKFYTMVDTMDGASVRFHLERRTEKWKAKQVLEHHVSNITLEDLIDADNAKSHGQDQARIDRGTAENPQQAEGGGAVSVERGPDVLLEPPHAPQHSPESPPEGAN